MKQQSMLTGGTVEAAKLLEKMFNQLASELARPIIRHGAWSDLVTADHKFRVMCFRMKRVKEGNGEPITEVTDYEALLWVMTEAMTHPIDGHWMNIYTSLFNRFYPEKAKNIFGEYELKRKLDLYEIQELRDLKRKLFRKSMKAMKT